MSEPRRAQNYIPISGRGRRTSEPQRYRTDGNLAVEIERRVQKKPANRETAPKSAPRDKNLFNNRIEETPGRKMPLRTANRQGSAAVQQKKAPVQQRMAQERRPAAQAPVRQQRVEQQPRQQAPVRQQRAEQPRQQRAERQPRQKAMAQGYRSIMQGGHVSMRGEMAIPMPQTKIKVRPERERVQAPLAGAQTAARPKGLVSTILLIVFVFGILTFLLMRNAAISDIGLKNASLQKNITTLSQSLDKVKLDVTLQDDLSSIRARAQQLGMGNPGSGQITYLPKEDTALADTPAASDTQTADSSKDTAFNLNSLFKEIKSLFG